MGALDTYRLSVLQVGLILAFKYGTEKGNRNPQLLSNLGIQPFFPNLCRVCDIHWTHSAFAPFFVQLSFKNKLPKTEHYLFCSVTVRLQPWTFTLRPKKINSWSVVTVQKVVKLTLMKQFTWKKQIPPQNSRWHETKLEMLVPRMSLLPHLQPCWDPHMHMDGKGRKQHQDSFSLAGSVLNNLISHLAGSLA